MRHQHTVPVKRIGGRIVLVTAHEFHLVISQDLRIGQGRAKSSILQVDENLNNIFIILVTHRDIKLHKIFMRSQITAQAIEMIRLLHLRGFIDYLLPVFINLIGIIRSQRLIVVIEERIELEHRQIPTEVIRLDIIGDNRGVGSR